MGSRSRGADLDEELNDLLRCRLFMDHLWTIFEKQLPTQIIFRPHGRRSIMIKTSNELWPLSPGLLAQWLSIVSAACPSSTQSFKEQSHAISSRNSKQRRLGATTGIYFVHMHSITCAHHGLPLPVQSICLMHRLPWFRPEHRPQ